MKYIISFIVIYVAIAFQANADDICDKKKNEKILSSLLILNTQYKGDIPALSNECKNTIRKILSEYDDPYEVARLMVLSNGIIRTLDHENRISSIFSALTEYYGMQRLKELISHQNFTEAMCFIERSIRLGAGMSEMFSEVIWEARDIDGIKKYFKSRIKQQADDIRKHGSKSDKKILFNYEKKESEKL